MISTATAVAQDCIGGSVTRECASPGRFPACINANAALMRSCCITCVRRLDASKDGCALPVCYGLCLHEPSAFAWWVHPQDSRRSGASIYGRSHCCYLLLPCALRRPFRRRLVCCVASTVDVGLSRGVRVARLIR